MQHEGPLLVKDGITGEKWQVNLACDSDFHINHRVLLHAANLRHETDGFTSPPKEGMLWIFSPENSDSFGQDRTRDLGYQEALHKRRLVYCMSVMSDGCYQCHFNAGAANWRNTHSIYQCVAPPEDAQVMLKTCRGP
jgi:hypothetical protein